METIITYGIVYLLVFRLAVLLLGGLCIFWGYRLFLVRGYKESGSSPDQGGELHGKFGSSELMVKSAAPGIFFAAFGAIIVIAVLAGQQPNVGYSSTVSRRTVKGAGQHKPLRRHGMSLSEALRRAVLHLRMRARQTTTALSVIFPKPLTGSGQQSVWPPTIRITVTCWPGSFLPGAR